MPGYEGATVFLSIQAQETLVADVHARRQIEACGALLGCIDEVGNWHIEQAYPLRNIFDSAVYFEFAPEELLEIELNHPGRMVGVYHSHPTGFARASATDRENMRRVNVEQQIPWVWLIYRGPFSEQTARENSSKTTVSMSAYYYDEVRGLEKLPIKLGEQKL